MLTEPLRADEGANGAQPRCAMYQSASAVVLLEGRRRALAAEWGSSCVTDSFAAEKRSEAMIHAVDLDMDSLALGTVRAAVRKQETVRIKFKRINSCLLEKSGGAPLFPEKEIPATGAFHKKHFWIKARHIYAFHRITDGERGKGFVHVVSSVADLAGSFGSK